MNTEVVCSTKTMFIHDKPTDLSVRTDLYNDLTEESVSVASTTSTGFCRVVLSMPDIGNPAGFDIATVLTGSGITLLLSAGIIEYGEQFSYTAGELYAMSGVALVALGVVFGLLLVLIGYR